MAEYETIADIIAERRAIANEKRRANDPREYEAAVSMDDYTDRLDAAHKRERGTARSCARRCGDGVLPLAREACEGRRREVTTKLDYNTCANCGRKFTPTLGAHQKFCCANCRVVCENLRDAELNRINECDLFTFAAEGNGEG